MPALKQNIADSSGAWLMLMGQQVDERILSVVCASCVFLLRLVTSDCPFTFSSESYRFGALHKRGAANSASFIPFYTISLSSRRSSLIKGAHIDQRALDTVLSPFLKVFPQAGFMPFKPGI